MTNNISYISKLKRFIFVLFHNCSMSWVFNLILNILSWYLVNLLGIKHCLKLSLLYTNFLVMNVC